MIAGHSSDLGVHDLPFSLVGESSDNLLHVLRERERDGEREKGREGEREL